MVLRLALLALLLPYAVWLVVGYEYHLVDNVNLAVHEAGHMVFTPFGRTMHMLGGTLLQLLVPLVFVARFLLRERPFDALVCGVWFAESLMYTAVYVADAYLMSLPLVGGEIHDWNWMLSKLGLVGSSREIGAALHVAASLLVLGCVAGAGWITYRDRRRALATQPPVVL
jgi:hypothetical protein